MEVTSSQPCRPLVKVFESVPDPRLPKGRRYSMQALLSLCCAGMLCGCRTYGAISQWGRECDVDLARRLGFSVVTTAGIERRPGASTLFYALRALNRESLEGQLTAWVEELLAALPSSDALPEAVALDGKTLRGSAKALGISFSAETRERGADRADVPGVHLLSALSHRLGLTVAQRAVDRKSNEITCAPALLQGILLEGRVVTMDALLTQRPIARAIIKKKGTT